MRVNLRHHRLNWSSLKCWIQIIKVFTKFTVNRTVFYIPFLSILGYNFATLCIWSVACSNLPVRIPDKKFDCFDCSIQLKLHDYGQVHFHLPLKKPNSRSRWLLGSFPYSLGNRFVPFQTNFFKNTFFISVFIFPAFNDE